MPRKLESNEDLVCDLMKFSPRGPLGQVFIIEAIRKYAETWAAMTPEQRKQYQDKSPLISMEAWCAVAEDVKARCDKFYNR